MGWPHRLQSTGRRAQQETLLELERVGLESVVVLTLASTSSGTMVRMEQSGFRPDQEVAYRGASYGWPKFLGGLEPVVAKLT